MSRVTVRFPTLCFGCKSERKGITDGLAIYACGTVIGVQDGKIYTRKTKSCQNMPPGMTLSNDGTFSGTPTKVGVYGPVSVLDSVTVKPEES